MTQRSSCRISVRRNAAAVLLHLPDILPITTSASVSDRMFQKNFSAGESSPASGDHDSCSKATSLRALITRGTASREEAGLLRWMWILFAA